jgi:hypothetical protein
LALHDSPLGIHGLIAKTLPSKVQAITLRETETSVRWVGNGPSPIEVFDTLPMTGLALGS